MVTCPIFFPPVLVINVALGPLIDVALRASRVYPRAGRTAAALAECGRAGARRSPLEPASPGFDQSGPVSPLPPVYRARGILTSARPHSSSPWKWHLEEIGGKSNLRSPRPHRTDHGLRESPLRRYLNPQLLLQLRECSLWYSFSFFPPLILSFPFLMGE